MPLKKPAPSMSINNILVNSRVRSRFRCFSFIEFCPMEMVVRLNFSLVYLHFSRLLAQRVNSHKKSPCGRATEGQKNRLLPTEVSRPSPCYGWFRHLDIPGCSRSRSGKQFHTAYNQHSLRCVGRRLFGQLYSHPKEPFLKRRADRPERIGCNRYRYRKF